MVLNLIHSNKPMDDFSSIIEVDNTEKADVFALIASKSFDYEALPSTIRSLVNSKELKLFLGKINDE